jgi:hypothetical protein
MFDEFLSILDKAGAGLARKTPLRGDAVSMFHGLERRARRGGRTHFLLY